jgi:hypothetical protein
MPITPGDFDKTAYKVLTIYTITLFLMVWGDPPDHQTNTLISSIMVDTVKII